ncbi:hypothetical protein H4W32_006105 [Actinophytocola algeriensis]|uniref:Uncharacterized protein n=1 Tax=Actinophytocola algeriensis TaxID=1768010 RepID=A0A7W7VDW8_9PSEU|nr:hypothetical protein [Actinophytocola algeriensis]MBE1478063.1 hypothetical protein [Actinophytocola algeriensis]
MATKRKAAILRGDLTIRIFENSGNGQVHYLGVFQPDSDRPRTFEQAPDYNGEQRNVLVFKLWAAERRTCST